MKLEDFKKKNEKDIFELQQREEVPLLFYKRLQEIPWIKHCFTTRGGGVSQGIFSSMNLSFTRGDEREAVEENFHRIAKAMGTEYGKFVFTDQTHTTNVRKVEAKDAGAGILRERGYHDVDGLITDVPGMVLSFLNPILYASPIALNGFLVPALITRIIENNDNNRILE